MDRHFSSVPRDGFESCWQGDDCYDFISFALYDIAYTPLLIAYTIEILPFKIRAKGFAAMSFTVTLGLIFNQYVNPVALEKLGRMCYLIYVGWLVFELGFI